MLAEWWCIKSTDQDKWSHVYAESGSSIINITCNDNSIVLGSDLICNDVGKLLFEDEF